MQNTVQRLISYSSDEWRRGWGMTLIAVGMIGMLYSPALLSISLIGLMINTFVSFDFTKAFPVYFRSDLLAVWHRFSQHPGLWAFSLLFIWILVTGIYSDDMRYWTERLRIKLPFLGIPIALAGLPNLSHRQFTQLLWCWILIMLLTCLGVSVHFALHAAEVIDGIKRGKAVPVPTHHVRFSLMVALAAVSAGYLYFQGRMRAHSFWKTLSLVAGLVFVGMVHLLAVRSGLAVFYGMVIIWISRLLWQPKYRKWGWVLLVSVVILPILAYQTVPSIQAKVGYMLWDWKQYQAGKGSQYADSERMRSLQMGWELVKEHPFWGVGSGDLKQSMDTVYRLHHPQVETPMRPHNQYLSMWAATGWVGLCIFLMAWFTPLLYARAWRCELLFLFYVVVSLSFMVENTIENAVGVGFTCLLWLLFMWKWMSR